MLEIFLPEAPVDEPVSGVSVQIFYFLKNLLRFYHFNFFDTLFQEGLEELVLAIGLVGSLSFLPSLTEFMK